MTVVASFNCGNAAPAATPADLDILAAVFEQEPGVIAFRAEGAAILGLCETGDRHKVITGWCRRTGFAEVPFEHGAGDTPILYDPRRVALIGFTHYPVMDRETWVGPEGSGPSRIHVKYVTHAWFRDLETGRLIHVLNTHLLASWTRNNLPSDEEKARRDLAARHIAVLTAAIRPLRGVVVVTGDYNGPKEHPIMAPLAALVDLGNAGPTLGNKTVDFAGVRAPVGVLITVTRRVEKRTSSDHDAVVVVIVMTLTKRADPVTRLHYAWRDGYVAADNGRDESENPYPVVYIESQPTPVAVEAPA